MKIAIRVAMTVISWFCRRKYSECNFCGRPQLVPRNAITHWCNAWCHERNPCLPQ